MSHEKAEFAPESINTCWIQSTCLMHITYDDVQSLSHGVIIRDEENNISIKKNILQNKCEKLRCCCSWL